MITWGTSPLWMVSGWDTASWENYLLDEQSYGMDKGKWRILCHALRIDSIKIYWNTEKRNKTIALKIYWNKRELVFFFFGFYLFVSNTYCGLFMTNKRGKMWIKTLFTQGDILCVCGERKWTFSTTTVTHILKNREKKIILSVKLFNKHENN